MVLFICELLSVLRNFCFESILTVQEMLLFIWELLSVLINFCFESSSQRVFLIICNCVVLFMVFNCLCKNNKSSSSL